MVSECSNLAQDFLSTAERKGNRLALSVSGVDYSYSALAVLTGRIAAGLRLHGVRVGSRVGILASRSLETFAGILGACWVGATYVPINVGLPGKLLANVARSLGLDALIVDKRGLTALEGAALDSPQCHILVPEKCDFPDPLAESPVPMQSDETAYIEFTSGTTGMPKGVMISVGAIFHFLSVMCDRYKLRPEDRVAATSDITFDISFANMFMAWKAGASLHVVPATQLMAPSKFIRERELTVWFSVPSIATFMRHMKLLKPSAFCCLRYSLFAGEPLPLDSARAWQQAAPDSSVENLYGPTEATVVCTVEPLNEHTGVTRGRAVVPIGRPLPGTDVAIVDSALSFLPPDQEGGGPAPTSEFDVCDWCLSASPIAGSKNQQRKVRMERTIAAVAGFS